MEEATTSIETLTNLVQQVLQSSQEMSTRLSSLEGLLQAQTKDSSSATDHRDDDDDDVSTIIPRRPILSTVKETVDVENKRSMFDFDDDLQGSRVYVRALRRKSFRSLRSDSKSFGWSCLSERSMADVSNISVISLPICGAELNNPEHYSLTETHGNRGFRFLHSDSSVTAQQGLQPPMVKIEDWPSPLTPNPTPNANIFLWGKHISISALLS